MREGPHSGAVAPKHRLVLETVLLLQCHLCISQDAWVSMETTSEQATAGPVALPHPVGVGHRCPGSALYPPYPGWLFPSFRLLICILMGVLSAGW